MRASERHASLPLGMVSPPKSERETDIKVKGTPFHSDRNKLSCSKRCFIFTYEGLPYLSKEEEKIILKHLKDNRFFTDISRNLELDDEKFVQHQCSEVSKWLSQSKEGTMYIDVKDPILRYIIHTELRLRFPDILTTNSLGNSNKLLIYRDESIDGALSVQKAELEENLMNHLLGYCFVRLGHWLANENSGVNKTATPTELLAAVSRYSNKVNLIRGAVPYMVAALLANYGSIDVKPVGRRAALVVASTQKTADKILKQFDSKNFRVSVYSPYRHSLAGRMAVWYSSDFGAARLDPCELRTVVPYTYTLSERSAELHERSQNILNLAKKFASHQRIGGHRCVASFRIGICWKGSGTMEREWVTGILTHWMKGNSGNYNFTSVFCDNMIRISPTESFHIRTPSVFTTAWLHYTSIQYSNIKIRCVHNLQDLMCNNGNDEPSNDLASASAEREHTRSQKREN
ncbi:Pre-piRNA 3'-exonuclease trimmer [Eumeta japonica]|uniref:Pre-piRNA 3'-exonuclease trimmer n=1 Tax=Eumeta variegata TaxID=151549 RepID=A0A4C1UG74_EUMVA|nr:Pre-piRNA 3'-exonuclease trimmer [Eumeta japonica]